MDFSEYAVAATVLIGLINGVQFALNKNWRAFVFFLTSIIAGSVFGFFGWFGLPSIEIGFAVGLGASGVYKISQVIGSKTGGL